MDMEDLMKNLRLECKICYEQYSDSVMPKMLHCSHSFCKNCLERLVTTAASSNASVIRCPCCRKKNKFQTAKGVDSFKDNLDLRNVAMTVVPAEAVNREADAAATLHEEDGTSTTEETPLDHDGPCPKHGAEVNSYCRECSAMICNECVLADHYGHAAAVIGISEYAQQVKEEMKELLDLARNMSFMRIRKAAEKTGVLAEKKRDRLMAEVDRTIESTTAEIQDDIEVLDGAKQRLKKLGDRVLSDNSATPNQVALNEQRKCMRQVEDLLESKKSRPPPGIGLTFVGMRPDCSIGDFIKDKINIIGNIANDQTITYVADNRKHDSVVMVGTGHLGDARVSKWMTSFRTEDDQSPVVFSSQLRCRGQERLLLIAIGHFIYKVDTAPGRCIADQIDTIHVKEGVIFLEGTSSITGIDWYPEGDKSLAILSVNTGRSLYLIDTDTKALSKSIITSVIPSVISCRRGEKANMVIVRDNSTQSRVVVLNHHGREEFRISPSKGVSDYMPWVGCWVQATKPIRVAVVWCQSYRWKIVIHDGKGKQFKELEEQNHVAIPVSISYDTRQKMFVVCSKEGTQHFQSTL